MANVATWSRKDILRFIEIYRGHECLWRIKSPDYSNREMKDKAYDSLVKFVRKFDLQADRNEIVKKINNLRSSFRKEYKKIEIAKRLQEKYTPKLYYFEELMFLKDQDTNHPQSARCFGQLNSETTDTQGSDAVLKQEEPDFFYTYSSDLDMDATESNDQDSLGLETPPPSTLEGRGILEEQEPLQQSLSLVPPQEPIRRPTKKRKLPEDELMTHSSAYSNSSFQNHPQRNCDRCTCRSSRSRDDKHDIFGQHVANTIQEMSTDQQIIAEKIISDVLYEGRFGNLSRATRLKVSGVSGSAV